MSTDCTTRATWGDKVAKCLRFAPTVAACAIAALGACHPDAREGHTRAALTSLAGGIGVWQKRSDPTPEPRLRAAMAYDPVRARTVMFGGSSSDDAPLGDTWEWDGNRWQQALVVGPPADRQPVMVYFPRIARTVLVSQGAHDVSETWMWNGQDWSRMCDTATGLCVAPASRDGAAIAHDSNPAFDVLRFYGGRDSVGSRFDFWEFDGTTWHETPATNNPGKQYRSRMAFDPRLDATVLVPIDSGLGQFDLAWQYDATQMNWTGESPGAALSDMSLAYSPVAQWILGFSGDFNAILAWDPVSTGGWTLYAQLPIEQQRRGAAFTFDTARNTGVLFGGQLTVASVPVVRGDTWEFFGVSPSAEQWTPRAAQGISPRTRPQMYFDSNRGVVSQIGGAPEESQVSWEWNGAGWQLVPYVDGPATIIDSASAFDQSNNMALFFGGLSGNSPNGATWSRVANTWTSLCTSQPGCPAPSKRSRAQMAFDSTAKVFFLVGGVDSSQAWIEETWKWTPNGATDGAWQQVCAAPCQSPNDEVFAAVYDSARGRVIALGKTRAWEFDPAVDAWNETVAHGFDQVATAVYSTALNQTLVIGTVKNEDLSVRAWDGLSWTIVPQATGALTPSARSSASSVYDPGRGRVLLFGGTTDGGARLGDTWEFHVRGNDCGNPRQCETGYCVDGACCESFRCGVCNRCDTPGDPRGTCADVEAGTTDDVCNGALVCGPNAHCGAPVGATCGAVEDCADLRCQNGRCVGPRPIASSCVADNDCGTLHCVDGVCCATAVCTGSCTACNVPDPTTGRLDGMCRVAIGANPRGVCDGSGAACSGTCGADGNCVYPTREITCGQCLACNGEGACTELPLSAKDDRCPIINCSARDTECRSYGAASDKRCYAPATCARDSDPGVCERFTNAVDGVACSSGICMAGECIPVAQSANGCQLASRDSAAAGSAKHYAWLALVIVFALLGRRGRSALLLLAITGTANAAPQARDAWQRVGIDVPTGRDGHALAYDEARGRVVLFGGGADTWEWNGSSFERMQPIVTPELQRDAPMAYDGDSGTTILVGMSGGAAATWSWDGLNWTLLCSAGACGIGDHSGGRMAYHAAAHQLLLHGGIDEASTTFIWDGASWQARATLEPSARLDAQMAYDSVRERIVLTGGQGISTQSVWEWDGTLWTEHSDVVAPNACYYGALSDAGDGSVVLIGGADCISTSSVAEMWRWNGIAWTQLANAQFSRKGGAATYDRDRARVVFFGGADSGVASSPADLWEWNGLSWTARATQDIQPRVGASATYDPVRRVTLMLGGDTPSGLRDELWAWNSVSWTMLSPLPEPVRPYSQIAFLSRVGETFAMRGSSLYGWDGVQWKMRCVGCSGSPASIGEHAATSNGDNVFFFGGIDTTNHVLDEFWSYFYTGVRTQLIPMTGPTPAARKRALMAAQGNSAKIFLVGGVDDSGVPLQETWYYQNGTWTAGQMPPENPVALYYNTRFETVELLDASFARYHWIGEQWNRVDDSPDVKPSQREGVSGAYDVARSRFVMFGGASSGAPLGDTWELHTRGQHCNGSTQCETGYCVDEVCCEVAVCGSCESCVGGAGLCSPLKLSSDDTCQAPHLCNNEGQCRLGEHETCAASDECAVGICYENQCIGERLPSGALCGADDSLCASNLCRHGVCCTSSCDGKCERCDQENPVDGVVDGECRIAVGKDLNGKCHGDLTSCDGVCDVGGECDYPGAEKSCGLCIACDDAGHCTALPASGADARCVAIECQTPPECRRYLATEASACISVGTCRGTDDPGACDQLENVEDETACTLGVCRGGRCVETEIASAGCQLCQHPMRGAPPSWLFVGLSLWGVFRARRTRRT